MTSRTVGPNAPSAGKSQIFHPYRALGYVTNHVPFALQTKTNTHFITTCIGDSFQMYNAAKMNLLFVSSPVGEPITCMDMVKDNVITCSGNQVISWHRGRKVRVVGEHTSNIQHMLCFGGMAIVCDDSDNTIMWDLDEEREEMGRVELGHDNTFKITALVHPSTYLNKILLGSRQGKLILYNIHSHKVVYEYKGWGSPVLCIQQSPAVDVVGVGLEDGRVIVHNLRTDKTVCVFRQEWGPVTSITFRDDEHPVVCVSAGGKVVSWNLERRRQIGVMAMPHDGSTVTCVRFLPSQPILITSGTDNSVRMWVFDQPDALPRHLRSRNGHSAPPIHVQYYGPTGKTILTAGIDQSMRLFSTIRDAQNIELSQGNIASRAKKIGVDQADLKLPSIISFATAELRERDWDNLVTCHSRTLEARTWKVLDKCIGSHKLRPNNHKQLELDGVVAKTCAMSQCGNWVFVGLSNGQVDQYSMQSGRHKATLGGIPGTPCHEGELVPHFENDMVAVICDDFSVHLVDIEMKRVVRVFEGHTNRVTDATFSPDGRWLVTASMDATVRVWDVVAGRLLDWMRVPLAVTGLSFSPTGDFLSTTHVDSLGVYMWANMMVFSSISLKETTEPEETSMEYDSDSEDEEAEHPYEVQMPTMAGIVYDSDAEEVNEIVSVSTTEDNVQPERDFNDNLTSLTGMPASFWHSLAHLETIKERNKPTAPPSKPKAAPFFLPTMTGVVPSFIGAEDGQEQDSKPRSRIFNTDKVDHRSPFCQLLSDCDSAGDYTPLLEMVMLMSVSAIDLEIRSLDVDTSVDCSQYHMVRFFVHELQRKTNFEMIESLMASFLQIHAETLPQFPELMAAIADVQKVHSESWERISNLLNHTLCMVTYMRGATI
eukprot:CFRG7953T1